jgi:glycosyltransferase involved in cell wall biosynthesis
VTKDVIKIGFVSHSSGLRGAERALLEAIDALRDYPVDPIVFVPGKGPLVDELRSMGTEYSFYTAIPWITTQRTIWRTLGKLLASSFYTLQLIRQFKAYNCQIVYSNSLAIAMGAWAAYLAHIPHLWHIHEFGYEDHGVLFDLGEQITKRILRKIGGFFIVNSYVVAQKYSRMINSPAFDQHNQVIYQSVTIPPLESGFERPVPHYETTILLVGALHENKGQADAIYALSMLREQGFNVGLLLVGDGNDKLRLQRLAEDLSIHKFVHFIGFVENVSNWYALSDIVLVCSRMEAFGRIAIRLYREQEKRKI